MTIHVYDNEQLLARAAATIFASEILKKPDCVIVGADAGSKLTKAQELGIKTMDEEEALSHLSNLRG